MENKYKGPKFVEIELAELTRLRGIEEAAGELVNQSEDLLKEAQVVFDEFYRPRPKLKRSLEIFSEAVKKLLNAINK